MAALDTALGLGRYATLIQNVIERTIFRGKEAETSAAVGLERGIVWARLLIEKPSPALARDLEPPCDASATTEHRVIDSYGHQRPAYEPLLVYAWLQSFGLLRTFVPEAQSRRWEQSLHDWCDRLQIIVSAAEWSDGKLSASRGAAASGAAWAALALQISAKVLGRDADAKRAAGYFDNLARSQRENGSFLSAGVSDNPETLWYHELVILHAAASYAVQAGDGAMKAAVWKNTAFHLAETQPDHATNQPWGLTAFVWNPDTRLVADGMLHALAAHDPGRTDAVSLMLLTDALYCLQILANER